MGVSESRGRRVSWGNIQTRTMCFTFPRDILSSVVCCANRFLSEWLSEIQGGNTPHADEASYVTVH